MSDEGLSSVARIEELKAKFERDPNSKLFLQLAEEYRKANRFAEAIATCLHGLERHPGYTTARVTLARAYLGGKRASEAKTEFEKVLASVPDHPLANRYLGDIYYDEGRQQEALKRYRVVAMLNPSDDEVASRIQKIEGVRLTAAELLPRKPAPLPVAAAADGVDDMAAFMDLKIDESVILNSEMVAAALGAAGKAAMAAHAATPPVARPEPPPIARRVEPIVAAPEEAMSEFGEADEFSEFSSPTVMLSSADLMKIPGVADDPKPAAPAAPAAVESPRADFAARSAQKFGLGKFTAEPPAKPVPPPPAPLAPALAVEDEGVGMDDFSEFAAPTVMMNVKDLMKSGALGGEPLVTPHPAPGAAMAKPAPPADPFTRATAEMPAVPEQVLPALVDEAVVFGTRAMRVDELEALRALPPPSAAPSWESAGALPSAPAMPLEPAALDDVTDPPFAEAAGHNAREGIAEPSGIHTGSEPAPFSEAAPFGEAATFAEDADPFGGGGTFASPFDANDGPAEEVGETRTLGFLYLDQGNVEQGLGILERYLAGHPEDLEVRARIEAVRGPSVLPRLAAAPVVPAPVAATPAPTPVPVPAAAAVAIAPVAEAAPPAGGDDQRKQKIQKLSNWLASLKKP